MTDFTLMNEEERLTRLTGEVRDMSGANSRPLDASTLIIVDRKGPKPRVLMGLRHPSLKFMPSKYVFPGGRAERGDGRLPVASELASPVASLLAARNPRPAKSLPKRLGLAALRETFEETGLVIGGAYAGTGTFEGEWDAFFKTGNAPALGSLIYLARAITPPRRLKRFDTRFFVADANAITHSVEGIGGPDSELVKLDWLTIEDTAALPLPGITRMILADLHDAIAGNTLTASRDVPLYFMRNWKFRRELITP